MAQHQACEICRNPIVGDVYIDLATGALLCLRYAREHHVQRISTDK